MSKKHSVLVDELKIKGGGIYCFLPFSTVDEHHKAVFKIGIAKKLIIEENNTIHTFHTVFIM